MRSAPGHPARAAAFLADPHRARWHDQTLWHVRTRRDRASESVPEFQALRARAREIKAHALSRLPDYLEEFEAQATKLGAVVHWARDGQEHNRIVHRLLQDRGVTLVAKSKSMLTEECGLNPYLEARGIEVVDTDLGERIVQMRGEPPSHIVMPAIHLKKEEIGELFHERLGTEAGVSDPGALTEAARRHLREKFLAAGAGITGVNFAIAETGGVVVCTNEGNADLGTSLPPLHIACMGIEKILPRVSDLAVFLRLLARSATGQHITAYSSHFHGPRRGSEMHVVLVDNGRSALAQDDAFAGSLACIRCGACFNTCPVYRRSGGHSYATSVAGPIGSVLAPARDAAKHGSLPFACSLCGSCSDVCPVGIDLPHQLLQRRAWLAGRHMSGTSKRRLAGLARFVMARPELYVRLAGMGRALARLMPPSLLERLGGAWVQDRALPEMPKASFRERYRRGRKS